MVAAYEVLKQKWERTVSPSLRKVLLAATATSRLDEAVEFLISIVENGSAVAAKDALEVLSIYRSNEGWPRSWVRQWRGEKTMPLHWAEAAATSHDAKKATRTQALISLTQNPKYQRRFQRLVGDVPAFKAHLHRAVEVAALNRRVDMLPWLIRAGRPTQPFTRNFCKRRQ